MMSASPLTENPGGGGSLSGMLWLSLILHLLLVSVLLSLPPRPPATRTLGPAIGGTGERPAGASRAVIRSFPEILSPEATAPTRF